MALIRRLAALTALLFSLVVSLGWIVMLVSTGVDVLRGRQPSLGWTMLGGLVLIGVLIAGWSADRIRRGP
ncbi:hypothetical protein SAE02_77880 [Skermanella aerolata]|uniref:Uncharacterized protein n=1 Tax=Skermanella aerolata TaxID=393310 RepID=A0A512E574_9PROT|nr:hypothetical protein [Skermanella aerolata]KJB90197.1 hypothetical protein N826_04665 [Skermanella aerolata KACC 11604]GEO43640.1 hypothetical protein SAE02_77880 [Skermanella aerolata]